MISGGENLDDGWRLTRPSIGSRRGENEQQPEAAKYRRRSCRSACAPVHGCTGWRRPHHMPRGNPCSTVPDLRMGMGCGHQATEVEENASDSGQPHALWGRRRGGSPRGSPRPGRAAPGSSSARPYCLPRHSLKADDLTPVATVGHRSMDRRPLTSAYPLRHSALTSPGSAIGDNDHCWSSSSGLTASIQLPCRATARRSIIPKRDFGYSSGGRSPYKYMSISGAHSRLNSDALDRARHGYR